MFAGRNFSPADPGESENFRFDFIRDFDEGETIESATWTCVVAEESAEEDADAADHVSAPPPSYEGTVTTQYVSGLKAGVTYVLKATVGTSAGNTRSLWAHVSCREPT